MASTAFQSPLDLSNSSTITDHSYRSVMEEFTTLPGEETPLVAYFGYGDPQMMDETNRVQTIIDKLPPQTVTVNAAVVTADTSLTLTTTFAALLQKGQVLMVDNELIRVTTVAASTTVGVTKGFAGSTSTTHASGATVHILSPLFLTDDTFVTSPVYRGEFKNFELFRTQHGYEMTDARSGIKSYLTKGKNELEFEKERQQILATQKLERLLVYSLAQQMTNTQIGAPAGIKSLITTNATTVSGLLTASDLVDTIDLIYAHNPGNRDWTLIGNRNSQRIIHSIFNQYFDRRGEPSTTSLGVTVENFHCSLGDIKFMPVQSIKDGELYIVKKDDIKIHPLKTNEGMGTGWVEVTQTAKELSKRSTRVSYDFMGFLIMGDERHHGKITGFTSTGSSYAGFV